jgi:dTDP-4-amino-4,6-dideoxygalactose transaminase
MSERFTGSFTQQEPIPEAGIEAAMAVLRHGRLHRYNTAPGEVAETALLEEEFAAYVGAKYCLALASGGAAMACALRALQVGPGDPVLSNAFTLAPVPGAIASLGARPVFVEVTEDLTIDLAHLGGAGEGLRREGAAVVAHARACLRHGGAGRVVRPAGGAGDRGLRAYDGGEVEGRAVGPAWRDRLLFDADLQAHEFGEGGFLVTDDAELAARAVLLSGSYMLYARHRAAPGPEVFEALKLDVPNVSSRMDNLRAAILRPQIAMLEDRRARWRVLYQGMEAGLAGVAGLR